MNNFMCIYGPKVSLQTGMEFGWGKLLSNVELLSQFMWVKNGRKDSVSVKPRIANDN